jgi:hypothetical protein
VCFVWTQANLTIWLAYTNILDRVLVVHVLANVAKKNELGLTSEQVHAKLLATIQTRANLLPMTKKLARLVLVTTIHQSY